MATSVVHELTRPRGERWSWSLVLERVESGEAAAVWKKGVSVTPSAWVLRGGFAAFLALYVLLYKWDSVPWPQWDPPEPRQLTAFVDGPCCWVDPGPAEPVLHPSSLPHERDSTDLVMAPAGGRP